MTCLPAVLVAMLAALGPTPHHFATDAAATGIPFELTSNKVYVRARLADETPRWFVLDSGCPVTAVEMGLARQLKLPLRNERTIAGAGEGRAGLAETDLTLVRLPGLDLHPRAAWALAVNDAVSPYEGRTIDGLLGLDFLEAFVVRIDYPNRTLDVSEPKDFRPPAGAIFVPLEKAGPHYVVKGTLHLADGTAVEGRFVLDIGIRMALLVSTPFVDRHGLVKATGAGPLRTVGGGLGGETKARIGRVKSLTVGDLEIDAPVVLLSQEKKSYLAGTETDGLFGAEVFRRYRLTLDLPHKRAMFEPTPEAKAPYEFDASGLFLIASGDGLRSYKVLSVVPDGPAAKAGVEAGDVVTAVDGKPAGGLTLDDVRAALRDPGATRVLTLKRGTKEVTAKVTLRRPV
jgi:hypothetical protein